MIGVSMLPVSKIILFDFGELFPRCVICFSFHYIYVAIFLFLLRLVDDMFTFHGFISHYRFVLSQAFVLRMPVVSVYAIFVLLVAFFLQC